MFNGYIEYEVHVCIESYKKRCDNKKCNHHIVHVPNSQSGTEFRLINSNNINCAGKKIKEQ